MTKTIYRPKGFCLFLFLRGKGYGSRGLRVHHWHCREAWPLSGTVAGTNSGELTSQPENWKRTANWEWLVAFKTNSAPNDIFTPARLHPLSFSSQSYQLGTKHPNIWNYGRHLVQTSSSNCSPHITAVVSTTIENLCAARGKLVFGKDVSTRGRLEHFIS